MSRVGNEPFLVFQILLKRTDRPLGENGHDEHKDEDAQQAEHEGVPEEGVHRRHVPRAVQDDHEEPVVRRGDPVGVAGLVFFENPSSVPSRAACAAVSAASSGVNAAIWFTLMAFAVPSLPKSTEKYRVW